MTIKYQNEIYQKKSFSVERFVKNNFSLELLDFVELGKWEEDPNLCCHLIADELNEEEYSYINEKLDIIHLRDRRTPQQYGCDLVLGWIIEDGILNILSEEGFKCNLSSADMNRKFLKKPSATFDLKLHINSKESVYLEITSDYGGYWIKNQQIDLRDNKYLKLKEEDGDLMGIDFKNGKFIYLPKLTNWEAKFIDSHWPYGGKSAYALSLERIDFFNLDDMRKILPRLLKNR